MVNINSINNMKNLNVMIPVYTPYGTQLVPMATNSLVGQMPVVTRPAGRTDPWTQVQIQQAQIQAQLLLSQQGMMKIDNDAYAQGHEGGTNTIGMALCMTLNIGLQI